MYIIRAVKANTNEFVDIAKLRSKKEAKVAIIQVAEELHDNGESLDIHMGIHQFTHHPKKGSDIVYFITVD